MKKFCVKIKASCILNKESVYVPSENLHLMLEQNFGDVPGEPHCYIWVHADSEEQIMGMLGKEQKIMEIVS